MLGERPTDLARRTVHIVTAATISAVLAFAAALSAAAASPPSSTPSSPSAESAESPGPVAVWAVAETPELLDDESAGYRVVGEREVMAAEHDALHVARTTVISGNRVQRGDVRSHVNTSPFAPTSRSGLLVSAGSAIVGGLAVRHAIGHAGNSVAYLVGIELLAIAVIALVVAVLGLGSRTRRLGAAAAAILAIAAGIVAWVVPGSTDVEASWGSARQYLVSGALAASAVPLGDDSFVVRAAVDSIGVYDARTLDFIDAFSMPPESYAGIDPVAPIGYRVANGGVVKPFGPSIEQGWSADVTDSDTAEVQVLAAPVEGEVVVGVYEPNETTAWELIALDADGGERWRRRLGVGETPRGVARGLDDLGAYTLPRVVAVVDQGDGGADEIRSWSVLDPADGEPTVIGTDRHADLAVGRDSIAVLTTSPDECSIEVFDAVGTQVTTFTVDCADNGSVLMDSTGRIYHSVEGDPSWTGVVSVYSPDGRDRATYDDVQFPLGFNSDGFIRGADGDLLVDSGLTVDDSWSVVAGSNGTYVGVRQIESRNPRRSADVEVAEVVVIDMATGDECARWQFNAETYDIDGSALPGCRAVVGLEGEVVLVGAGLSELLAGQ